MHVAGEDLERRDDRGHPHRHGEHDACAFIAAVAQDMQRPDRADDERCRQIGGEQHVHEPVREGGVEDHRPPVGRDELADSVDRVAGRRLHPAVHRQDPERRHEGAERDH